MTIADEIHLIIQDILAELARAEHLHPVWPGVGHRGDHVRAAGKLVEESGEAFKEANNIDEGKGTIFHLRKELVQAGAMVFRNILNLEAVERQRINESAGQELSDEPEHGDNIEWHYLNMEYIYPQTAERLIVDDYSSGSGV